MEAIASHNIAVLPQIPQVGAILGFKFSEPELHRFQYEYRYQCAFFD